MFFPLALISRRFIVMSISDKSEGEKKNDEITMTLKYKDNVEIWNNNHRWYHCVHSKFGWTIPNNKRKKKKKGSIWQFTDVTIDARLGLSSFRRNGQFIKNDPSSSILRIAPSLRKIRRYEQPSFFRVTQRVAPFLVVLELLSAPSEYINYVYLAEK